MKKVASFIDGSLVIIEERDILEAMSKSYDLVYVDYRDSLDNSMDEIQKAIQKQEWYPLDESVDDWLWQAQLDGINYVFDELKKELKDGENDRLIDLFFEENGEEIEELIYERDSSNPIKDLIRNTGDITMFYDTGYEFDYASWDEETFQEDMDNLKEALQITDGRFDDKLSMMRQQASYGGDLVIYFRDSIDTMLEIGDNNMVEFHNPAIAIIDTVNGSGDHCILEGHSLKLPLDPTNIFVEKTIKYNYTYDVCGMYGDWCDTTGITFYKVDEEIPEAKKSGLHADLEREAFYKKRFEEGGCTNGDIDMRRHRGTFYVNEFPCGTHCPHCGMFWID